MAASDYLRTYSMYAEAVNVFGSPVICLAFFGDTMPGAEFTITVPDNGWLSDLAAATTVSTFSVESISLADTKQTAQIRISDEDLVPLLDDVTTTSITTDIEVLETSNDTVLVELVLESDAPQSTYQDEIPLCTPFRVEGQNVTWEFTLSEKSLSWLNEWSDSSDVNVNQMTAGGSRKERVPTPRQREFVQTGLRNGYYEIPRDVTLTELAEQMDVGKASASDTLARAERRIMEWFTTQKLDGTDSATVRSNM